MSSPTSATGSPACARCGLDGEHDFGTMWLCTDCYHIAGSTCSGFTAPASRPDRAEPPGGIC